LSIKGAKSFEFIGKYEENVNKLEKARRHKKKKVDVEGNAGSIRNPICVHFFSFILKVNAFAAFYLTFKGRNSHK
jgi:hypothetical protein